MNTTITVQGFCDQLNAQFDDDFNVDVDVLRHENAVYSGDVVTSITLNFECNVDIIESEIK